MLKDRFRDNCCKTRGDFCTITRSNRPGPAHGAGPADKADETAMTESRMTRFRKGLRNAFSLESPHGPLDEADHELLGKLARAVVSRQMGTPAVIFLESVRPLNSIGSQAMVFLRPFLSAVIKPQDYDRLTEIMDRREGIAALVNAIEAEQNRTKELSK